MSGTDEPGERAWAPDAGDDLERATENVLDGWPTAPPSASTGAFGYGEPGAPCSTPVLWSGHAQSMQSMGAAKYR